MVESVLRLSVYCRHELVICLNQRRIEEEKPRSCACELSGNDLEQGTRSDEGVGSEKLCFRTNTAVGHVHHYHVPKRTTGMIIER
jgi:hypothetical protein